MKSLVFATLCLFNSSTLNAQAPKKALCRYDLVGPHTPAYSLLEKLPLTQEECRQIALKNLRANKDSYYKVIIKDLKLGKMITFNLDGKEE